MRIWAKVIKEHKIQKELVRDFLPAQLVSGTDAGEEQNSFAMSFYSRLTEICKELDVSCPAVLQKHLRDFQKFRRVVFRPADFMEAVDFDRFELEGIEEKKKDSKVTYYTY